MKLVFNLNQRTGKKEKEHFRKNYGITAYQKGRAIRIANENPIEFAQNRMSSKLDYTRTDIKRAYAFVELGEVFQPDNNKSDFNFGEYRDEFSDFIEDIGMDFHKAMWSNETSICQFS